MGRVICILQMRKLKPGEDTEAVTLRTQGSQDPNVGVLMSEPKLSTQVLSFGTFPLVST